VLGADSEKANVEELPTTTGLPPMVQEYVYEPDPPLTAAVINTLCDESIVAVEGEIVTVGAALTVIEQESGKEHNLVKYQYR